MLRIQLIPLALVAGLAGACAQDGKESSASSPPASTSAPSPALAHGLTRVEDPSLVCMVNNTFMGKAQIPVVVEGRTYFGCCEMCKSRLANEPTTRAAIDPTTGEEVDKATAVIVRDSEDHVLYFANEQNLRDYRPAP